MVLQFPWLLWWWTFAKRQKKAIKRKFPMATGSPSHQTCLHLTDWNNIFWSKLWLFHLSTGKYIPPFQVGKFEKKKIQTSITSLKVITSVITGNYGDDDNSCWISVTERIMQSHLIVLGGVSRTHSNPFTGDEDEVADNTNPVYATLRTGRGSYFSPRQNKVSGLVSYLIPYKRNTHLL